MVEVIAWLLWSCIDLVLVLTGKIVVTAASFGQWRGERWRSKESRIDGAAGALCFKRDGQRVFTTTGLLWVGALFYVLLVVILLWYSSQHPSGG
ncbi:hypothetical protein [Comamonas suwonensis]|uniref:hypothetical protein n=1 Tax=Comamonas suwonensis TaxID=2606214 RepID=UPI00145ED5A1|nr:hypothetical protein [Comamonas suwonensis]MBI1624822.1 hypothetical protein [Comamonas suwonensis]